MTTSTSPQHTAPSGEEPRSGSTLLWLSVLVGVGVTAGLALVGSRDGFAWSTVTVCAVSAAALVLGAWCAPPTPLLGRRARRAGDTGVKTMQLVGGAVVAVLGAWLFTLNPGMAALVGIVVAMMLGALWPRPSTDETR